MSPPPGRSASSLLLVDLPLDPELAQDGGGDLFDGLAGGVDAADAFAAHHGLGLVDLEAAVVELGVLAARAALLADLVQALRGNGEAVEARLVAAQRFGQLPAGEILRGQGIGR